MAESTPVAYARESAFHALGLPDADELVLRADLMKRIHEILAGRGVGQAEAGTLMHMEQPLVSALFEAGINDVPLDRLLQALSDLGDVEVRVTPAASGRGRLHIAACVRC